MLNKKIFYNLQICRGIAALIVLIAHANLIIDKNLFSGFFIIGWNGVDFFFVLSGFIVYYINSQYLGQANKFSNYLKKRLIRIFPIYWFYTLLVILAHVALLRVTGSNLVNWFDFNTLNILKTFLLYPTNTSINEMPIIPVAWTLSFELFFYIIFGICILLKRYYPYIIGFWIIGIILFNIHLIDVPDNQFIKMAFSDKNYEFLFGCFIAQLALTNKIITNRFLAILILFLGISLLFISWINEFQNLRFFPKMDAINFGLPYSLIIYALISLESSRIENRIKKIFVFLGDASYSIYLTHFIGIILLKSIVSKIGLNTYIEFTFIVVILTVIGSLCYSYIEKPLLKHINNWFYPKSVPVKLVVVN